jgi:predicted O-methyltransferase YrrM
MIAYLKQAFGNKPLTGIEIGVFRGENAKSILETVNIKKLYLIDPYQPYIENHFLSEPQAAEEIMFAKLKPFWNQVSFIKLKSHDAITMIPEQVDFVYIDGDHNYDTVKNDIEMYAARIKKGGIIGGHDISSADVCRAVQEYARENWLGIFIVPPDWFMQKSKSN